MELAGKICVKFSISLAKKKKKNKKRRGREGESTEKWGRKIMGLGKNQKWERRSSGAPSHWCSIMQEREKQRRGREGARRTGGEK
jgi:hypothetical protein